MLIPNFRLINLNFCAPFRVSPKVQLSDSNEVIEFCLTKCSTNIQNINLVAPEETPLAPAHN